MRKSFKKRSNQILSVFVLLPFIAQIFVTPLIALDEIQIDTSEDILEEGISDPAEIANPEGIVNSEEVVIPEVLEEEVVVEEVVEEPPFVYENGVYKVRKVVVGEEYVYPDNKDVRVKFTNVTEEGNLVIKRVVLTEEDKELLNTSDDYGWDISSSMSNGSFKYDLTLPNNTESNDVEVKYTEDGNTYESIDNEIVNKNVIHIYGLEHFTVFVVVDDGDTDFSAPGWGDSPYGYNKDHKGITTSTSTGNTATWKFNGDAGEYAILPSWVIWDNHATNAHYTSTNINGFDITGINQKLPANTSVGSTVNGTWSGWYPNMGRYNLDSGDTVTLSVESGITNGNYLVADAMAFINLNEIYVNQAWSTEVAGKDLGDGKIFGINAFRTIQEGINAVSAGGTVNVEAGTYTSGFSIIDKTGLTISGSGSSNTVIQPNSLISSGIAHKDTSNMLVSVLVNNSTDITIQNMTIKDNGLTPGSGGPDAIVLWNASSGTIKDSNITGTYTINGIQSGQGIALDASGTQNADLTVNNVAISGFQKNGIDAINGNGATSGSGTINLSVIGGSITGAGATSAIAQNGIVMWNRGGGTVTGTVNGTHIQNFKYTPSENSASGILAFGDGKIESVKNASFSNCDYYLATGNQTMNATDNNSFDDVVPSSATIAQLGAIQDRLLDKLDKSSVSTANSIFILSNTAIATPNNRGIQAAIDAVTSGGTVYVTTGTYTEQISITKSLHLIGAGTDNSIIKAPNTIPAASDQNSNIVKISGNDVNAEIEKFTITGPGPSTCESIGSGIFVLGNAHANIHDNKILDVRDSSFSGCQNGIAIRVGRQALSTAGNATITQNVITGYQKGGIVVDNEGSNAVITNNTVTGVGTTDIIAQNGIQISRGATATLSGNTVTGNSFHNESNSSNWSSAGILLYQSGAVTMSGGNTITGNDLNLYKGGASGLLTLGIESLGESTAPVGDGADIYNDDNEDIDATKVIFIRTIYGIDIESRVFHMIDDTTKGLVTWTTVNLDAPVQTGYNVNDGTSESEPRDPNQIACTGGYTNINGFSIHWTDVSGEDSHIKYIRQYSTNGTSWSGNEIYTNPYTNYRNFGGGSGTEGKYYSQVSAFYDIDNDNVRDINEPMSAWSNICSITYDKTTPTISNVNVDKTFVRAGDTVTITANVTDNTGVLAVSADFSNNEGYTSIPTPTYVSMSLVSGNTYSATFVIPAGWANGQIFVKVAARDLTGSNWVRSTEYKTFIVDNTAPTNPVMQGFNNPTLSCGAITNSKYVTVNWSDSSDTGSGVKGYNYKIDYPTTTGGRGEYNAFFTNSQYRGSLNEGLHTIKVQAVDNAGNVSEWTSPCSVTLDTIAPQIQNLKYYKNDTLVTTPSTTPIFVKSIDDLTYGADYWDNSGLNRTAFVIWDATDTWSPVSNSHKCNWNGSPSTTSLNPTTSQTLSGIPLKQCNSSYSWPSGKYIISHVVYDNAGNSSYNTDGYQRFIIENTAPTATINGNSPKGFYNNSDTNIAVHSIDDNYLETEFYSGDSIDPFKIYTGEYFGISWFSDGDYRMVVIDKAGNSTQYTFTIDRSIPTSSIFVQGDLDESKNITVNNRWFESFDNVDLKIATGNQNTDLINYQILDNDVDCPAQDSTGYTPVTHNTNLATTINGKSDGIYTLCYYASDLAGNKEATVHKELLRKDNTNPSFTIHDVSGNLISGVYYNKSEIKVPITINDIHSGYSHARYDLYNADASHNCTNKIGTNQDSLVATENSVERTLIKSSLSDGNYCLRIWVYDNVQNKAWTDSSGYNGWVKFTIDNTPPITPIATLTANDLPVLTNGYTSSETFTFNLSSSEDTTRYQLKYWNNIQGSQYNVDSPWSLTDIAKAGYMDPFGSYNDQFTQGEGEHYFAFSSCDAAGNCSQYSNPFVVTYDKTDPVITLGDYSTDWTNQDIVVTALTNEGTLNEDSYTFTENGSFEFIATDKAGNTTTQKVTIANIDKTFPTISPNISNDGLLTVTSSDTISNIKSVEVQINNGEWEPYTSGMNLYELVSNVPGTYTVSVKVTDNANNSTTNDTISFTIAQPAQTGEVQGAATVSTPKTSQTSYAQTPPNSEIEEENTTNETEMEVETNEEVLGETTCEATYKISGTIYYDKNDNGKYDEEEEVVEGIEVKIYNSDKELEKTVTTDEKGHWEATLCPGEYTTQVEGAEDQTTILGDSDTTLDISVEKTTNWLVIVLIGLAVLILLGVIVSKSKKKEEI